MLGKLLEWVVGREPVATATGLAGGVAAVVGVLAAFDVWRPTAEQTAAIGALVAWAAGYLARRAVTPVRGLSDVTRAIEGLGNGERGGVFVALVIAAACVFVLIAGFALCGDALFEDEGEPHDLGMARTEDNRPCQGDNACQGRQKKGCAEAQAPCSDDDQVTVIVCAQPDSCRFDRGEPA